MLTFAELFVGSELTHGTYDPSRKAAARTVHEPASAEDYVRHLTGVCGLGLVPVRANGTCRFGAIDIDHDTVDHTVLYQQVTRLKLPLHVCRSKSGGAHLYAFAAEPGVPAAKMKKQLEEWAILLGYGGVEIFPKQTKVGNTNKGNWLNLPYYGSDETTRYCVGPEGQMTLEAFLGSITLWNGQSPAPEASGTASGQPMPGLAGVDDGIFKIIGQGPPCIEAGVNHGIPAGARNSFMFNLAIGAKRAAPDSWREVTRKLNEDRCVPPLDKYELDTIINSVGRKASYEFQCQEGAISSLCNFQSCLKRPYGKGYKRETDHDNFDQLQLSHLRKINTDPPRYILECNGVDLELDTDQLLLYTQLRRRIVERLDIVAPPVKQDRWELQLQELLRDRQDIDAPEDASRHGLLMERVRDYLGRYRRAKSVEDILKDVPFLKGERVSFRASGLFRFLSQYRLDGDPQQVFAALHGCGGQHTSMRIKGKVTAVWSIPYSELREQIEEYTAPELPAGDEIL